MGILKDYGDKLKAKGFSFAEFRAEQKERDKWQRKLTIEHPEEALCFLAELSAMETLSAFAIGAWLSMQEDNKARTVIRVVRDVILGTVVDTIDQVEEKENAAKN